MPERIPIIQPYAAPAPPLYVPESDASAHERREIYRILEDVYHNAGIRVYTSVRKEWVDKSRGSGFQTLTSRSIYNPPISGVVTRIAEMLPNEHGLPGWSIEDVQRAAHAAGVHEIIRIGYPKGRSIPHKELVEGGLDAPAVEIDYMVVDEDWEDYSGREGQQYIAEMILPEQTAKEFVALIENDPTLIRGMISNFLFKKLLGGSHDVISGDDLATLMPRNYDWDPDRTGMGMLIKEEPEIVAWGAESVPESEPWPAQFESDLAKEQSAGLEDVDRITADARVEAADDVVAQKIIDESAEVSERAIADATREARNAAKRRVAERVRDEPHFYALYAPKSPPILEILRNAEDVQNDNDRQKLAETIEEKESRLRAMEASFDRGELSGEIKELERTVLERELALYHQLRKKDELSREIERKNRWLEELNEELDGIKKQMDELQARKEPTEEWEEARTRLMRDREHVARKRSEAITFLEQDHDQLFVVGLALAGMDRLLSTSKDNLRELRDAYAERKEPAPQAEPKRTEKKETPAAQRTAVPAAAEHAKVEEHPAKTFARGFFGTGAILLGGALKGVGYLFKGVSWVLGKFEKWLDWTISTSWKQKFEYYAGLAELKPLDTFSKWLDRRREQDKAKHIAKQKKPAE